MSGFAFPGLLLVSGTVLDVELVFGRSVQLVSQNRNEKAYVSIGLVLDFYCLFIDKGAKGFKQ